MGQRQAWVDAVCEHQGVIGVRAPLAEKLKFKPTNVHFEAGMTEGTFFDLDKAIRSAPGTVCDPYLEKRYPRAKDLVTALKKKGTTKLLLHRVHPPDMGPELILPLEDPPQSI